MTTNNVSCLRRLIVSLAVLLGLSAIGIATAGERDSMRADKDAIAALIYCYAQGTDAIGDSISNADPMAAGRAIYRRCFSADAELRVWFPQQPFDSQTFPNPAANQATAPQVVIGPDQWATFVNSVFRGKGYTYTQHMMSNVETSVQGRKGRLTAYLNATHMIAGDTVGGPSRCVAVANGTYSAEVQKTGDTWKITRFNLTLITFNPVFQTGKGC
jgi:SnoaL-like domain